MVIVLINAYGGIRMKKHEKSIIKFIPILILIFLFIFKYIIEPFQTNRLEDNIFFACYSETKLKNLNNEEYYIKIHNKTITLYNSKKQDIDQYKTKDKILDYELGDIDGDGLDELVLVTKKGTGRYGNKVMIFKTTDSIEKIYEEDFSELKPWKIALGDVVGDGKSEISIGVYKKTPYHQEMDKRPFIYYYEDDRLLPKWRGSRLSKPFTDYNFADIDEDGIDELISIEILQNEKKVINTYKWKGFGFEGFLQSEGFDDIKDLTIEAEEVYVKIKDKEDEFKGRIEIINNNLQIERSVVK